jgi:hypothetical protein
MRKKSRTSLCMVYTWTGEFHWACADEGGYFSDGTTNGHEKAKRWQRIIRKLPMSTHVHLSTRR